MPLADKLRPKKIEDMVGQRHIIGKGKVLNKIIENKSIPNMILYGPPGTGKTTLANIIASITGKKYIKLNAVNCGVKEIKEIIRIYIARVLRLSLPNGSPSALKYEEEAKNK